MKVTRPRIGGVFPSLPRLKMPPPELEDGILSRAIVRSFAAASLRLGTARYAWETGAVHMARLNVSGKRRASTATGGRGAERRGGGGRWPRARPVKLADRRAGPDWNQQVRSEPDESRKKEAVTREVEG